MNKRGDGGYNQRITLHHDKVFAQKGGLFLEKMTGDVFEKRLTLNAKPIHIAHYGALAFGSQPVLQHQRFLYCIMHRPPNKFPQHTVLPGTR